MVTASAEPLTAPIASLLWPRYPTVYEINTAIWLHDLSREYGKPIDLSSVPAAEWDAIARFGFDGVWLMGVWERSPAGIAIANGNGSLLADFARALPDFRPEDNAGSPYCVRAYTVDRGFGGPEGLSVAREELKRRGMKLVLDFVPNHVAPDHPWVYRHPEYFIRGDANDARQDPSSYIAIADSVFAFGRDPFFPAWPDVLQLNAFNPGLRQAVCDTVSAIAEQCDGVRCDMAMLVMNTIFARTWGNRAGSQPATEYWVDVITATRKVHPGFLFVAEAYWDLEWQLQQQGFDFCYDKKLYDRLEHADAESIRLHLCADLEYQRKLLRFIENHDEPRAAATFSPLKQRAAAVTIATNPGLKLFHEGQFEGRKIRPPVFLTRRPDERPDEDLRSFYTKLLQAIDRPVFREGDWKLCERTGWPGNPTYLNLVAWSWRGDDERYLIVVNLSDKAAQARVRPPWPEMANAHWLLVDALAGITFERDGEEISSEGLYVALEGWQYHFFQCLRLGQMNR